MENENRHNEIRTVHPNRLTPMGIIIIVLVGVMLLGLAVHHIPIPRQIDVLLPGAEVTKEGTVIKDGVISLEGIYYDYLFQDDRFNATNLELPNIEVDSMIEFSNGHPHVINGPMEADFIWTTLGFYTPNSIDSNFANVFTHSDFNYMLLIITGQSEPRYYIASGPNDPSYLEILQEFYIIPREHTK